MMNKDIHSSSKNWRLFFLWTNNKNKHGNNLEEAAKEACSHIEGLKPVEYEEFYQLQ